jgi:hypothetical protein
MKGLVGAFAGLVIFSIGGISLYRLAADEPETGPPTELTPSAREGNALRAEGGGRLSVRLTPEQQRLGGVEIRALEEITYHPELRAYGKVLDIQPLLDLRTRYRNAQAELLIAQAALAVSQKTYQRVQSLHKEEIIATRELHQAESQLASDRARVSAGRMHLEAIREEALQRWGGELFSWGLASDSKIFADFLTRQQLLLLVTLSAAQALPEDTRFIFVGRGNDRQNAYKAYLISPAPKTEDISQGETWFFRASAGRLRTGMRVEAWIPNAGEAARGVVLPRSAIIWHEGNPSVYLQAGPTAFIRRIVPSHQDYAGGWFVERGFSAGDRIVVSGGQMLLSEEFHRQIPDEEAD